MRRLGVVLLGYGLHDASRGEHDACLTKGLETAPTGHGSRFPHHDSATHAPPHRGLLQQHAALWVHGRRLGVRQPEGARVELVDALREAAEANVHAPRRGIRGVAAAKESITLNISAVPAPVDMSSHHSAVLAGCCGQGTCVRHVRAAIDGYSIVIALRW